MAHIDSYYDSDYIRFADLVGKGDVTLTIKEVKKWTAPTRPGQPKAKNMPVLYFEGTDKGLALNKTNKNTVKRLYGAETAGMIGKSITIYGDPHVRIGGEVTGGVRIRPLVPGQKPETE